ncbi:MAG: diguanylate cyclase, partial [Armatimonadota bacterium]|nr:diguanylate cyclase [Armatimonadota bacterium]
YSSIFPLRGADGGITGAISADVDISAQHAAEEALRLSEERLHTLYNTTSQQGLSFEEKTEAMLTMGCLQFGLEIGVLARVADEHYEVLQALSPNDAIPAGLTFPVCETYCSEALALADAVSFEQAGATERAETSSYQKYGLEAYIGAPIRVNGAVWGMLCFTGRQPHPRLFTSGDRELVRLMAHWVGGEIARRQAEEAVHESEERFRTAIASMSEALILMDAAGVIRLWNDSAERILEKTQTEMRGWRPLNPDFTPVREDGSMFPEGSYPLMVSLRRGLPQTDVVVGLPRAGGGMLWVSVNSKPLFLPGSDLPSSVVATFSDITERRRHEDLIQQQIMQIKDYTAVLETQKMELEAVNAELETLALRDGLTGLSNRRAFGQRVALEMGRAVRYGLPLSLLLLDVDHFKEYNDTFGHVAGDEVLKTLSQVLHTQGRETDFFARYGGEEFVIILPHTDSAGALTLAERLRIAIANAPWPARPVTASIGAATLLPNMEAEDDLVSAADRALYAAKAAGRNRVVHALSLDGAPPTNLSLVTTS